MHLLSTLKKYILKPAFLQVYQISPALAIRVRNLIYYGKSKKYKTKQSDGKARLLVDVSIITDNDAKTGIQRVVKAISQELYRERKDRLEFIKFVDGKLITSYKYLSKLDKTVQSCEEEELMNNEGDTLLLLDASWNCESLARKEILKVKAHNGKVYGIIHDLFPIQYPELFESKYFVTVFTKWHNMLLELCDGVICVSKTTADVVKRYYNSINIMRKTPLKIFYIHLGANFSVSNASIAVRPFIKNFVQKHSCFVMVGTIEPRKGHVTVLKAFEKLIDDGTAINLLIIGKDGWKNKKFTSALNSLPITVKKHILWIKDTSDDELYWAYNNTTALIAASKDEGFGLPLVEASHFGLPIICSDIPIFREVTGENATFFKALDSEDLSLTLSKWLKEDTHPASSAIRIYSWKETSKETLDIIEEKCNPLYEVI